ncbi:HEAT repeat-containing protein [Besnoitia besnoiti]|uniref:HEAT repeat-containing protein n=1 Tax=Besnoitia besnoiti TaxID=94643 RepID=A0A2A9MML9_BESBE|nr:HEAT repeat-containing protein [Besnoitia besnoiti]PFH37053.1 HEAT repeat-containing protein [Besnoitia besnoiti]
MERQRSGQGLRELLADMTDCDKDRRYMAACDLTALVVGAQVEVEYTVQDHVVRALLRQLEDSSIDVQGNAAKCLSMFTARLSDEHLESVLLQLIRAALDRHSAVRDIYAACLKCVIGELPDTSSVTFAASVLPELKRALATAARQPRGSEEEALEIFTETLRRFRSRAEMWRRAGEDFLGPVLDILKSSTLPLAVQKKALTSLGPLAVVLPSTSRHSLFRFLLAEVSSPSAAAAFSSFLFAQALAHVVRHLEAAALAPYVDKLAVFFFSLISKQLDEAAAGDDAEVRRPIGSPQSAAGAAFCSPEARHEVVELSLASLEAFFLRCPDAMATHADALDPLLQRLLAYFPNVYAHSEADRDGRENFEDEETLGFEKDFDFNDEEQDDDSSWRVRKGALKVLRAQAQAFPEREAIFYEKFLPALLQSTRDQDETLQYEALETLDEVLRASLRCQCHDIVALPTSPSSSASPFSASPAPAEDRGGREAQSRSLKRIRLTAKPLERALPSILAALQRVLATSRCVRLRLACLGALQNALFAVPEDVMLALPEWRKLVLASLRDVSNGSVRLAALQVVSAFLLAHPGLRASSPASATPHSSPARRGSAGAGRGGRFLASLFPSFFASFSCSSLGDGGERGRLILREEGGREIVAARRKEGATALLAHLVDPRLVAQACPHALEREDHGDGDDALKALHAGFACSPPVASGRECPRKPSHGTLHGLAHPHSHRPGNGKVRVEEAALSEREEPDDADWEMEEEEARDKLAWRKKEEFFLDLLPAVLLLTQDPQYQIAGQALLVTGHAIAFLRLARETGGDEASTSSGPVSLPSFVGQALEVLRNVLSVANIDQDVKRASLICFGFVVAAGGEFPQAQPFLTQCWPPFIDRIKNEVTRQTGLEALEVVLLSHASLDLVPHVEALVGSLVAFLSLQQEARATRQACLEILSALVVRYGKQFSNDALATMIRALAQQLTPADVTFSEACLLLLLLALRNQPEASARLARDVIFPHLFLLLRSPLLDGPVLNAAFQCLFVCHAQFPQVFDREQIFQELGDVEAVLGVAAEAEKLAQTTSRLAARADLSCAFAAPSFVSSKPSAVAPVLSASSAVPAALLGSLGTLARSRAVVVAAAGDPDFSQKKLEQEVKILSEAGRHAQPLMGPDLARFLLALLTAGEIGRLARLARVPAAVAEEAYNAVAALVESSSDSLSQRIAARALGALVSGDLACFLLALVSLIERAHRVDEPAETLVGPDGPAAAAGRRCKQYVVLSALRDALAPPEPFLRVLTEGRDSGDPEKRSREGDGEVVMSEAEHEERDACHAGLLADLMRPHIQTVLPLLTQLSACTEECDRCVVSECFGALLRLDPPAVMPTLLLLLQSSNADSRRTALGCMRHLAASRALLDEKQREAIKAPFLACQAHPDSAVRRDFMAALQALAGLPDGEWTYRWFSRDELQQIFEALAAEIDVKPELIRQVDLGPFRHTVDEGLPLRKAAYALLRALLRSSTSPAAAAAPVALEEAVPRERLIEFAVKGLSDENEDTTVLAAAIVSQLAAPVTTAAKTSKRRVTSRQAALIVSLADAAAGPLEHLVSRAAASLQRHRAALVGASAEGIATAAETAERQMNLLRVWIRCMHHLDVAFQASRGREARAAGAGKGKEVCAEAQAKAAAAKAFPAMKKVHDESGGVSYYIVDDVSQRPAPKKEEGRADATAARPGALWEEALARELQNPILLQVWQHVRKGEEGDSLGGAGRR